MHAPWLSIFSSRNVHRYLCILAPKFGHKDFLQYFMHICQTLIFKWQSSSSLKREGGWGEEFLGSHILLLRNPAIVLAQASQIQDQHSPCSSGYVVRLSVSLAHRSAFSVPFSDRQSTYSHVVVSGSSFHFGNHRGGGVGNCCSSVVPQESQTLLSLF